MKKICTVQVVGARGVRALWAPVRGAPRHCWPAFGTQESASEVRMGSFGKRFFVFSTDHFLETRDFP